MNGPSLMSNCLLIILVIGLCVIFGGFSSRFSKCCFHSYCFLLIFSYYTYTYIYICIFRQHFFVNANFIKHNRHFMSTYFHLDPFEFPYYFYRIRGKLIYVLSIVVCTPSTFCPTLGHHQGRIYYKSYDELLF